MGVKHDYLVGVAEKTYLLVSHFHGLVVDGGRLLDVAFQLIHIELHLRVGHLDGDQLLSLV